MLTTAKKPRHLGSLEQLVMEILWDESPLTVRAVLQKLQSSPPLAYTTVMTTLDRLHRKGLLVRSKDGLAFVYLPALSREDHQRNLIEQTVVELLRHSAPPVLASFVDAAARVDVGHLDELERLIAARRSLTR